jgi:hypothetical protein
MEARIQSVPVFIVRNCEGDIDSLYLYRGLTLRRLMATIVAVAHRSPPDAAF